jgi:hypothetical protein
MAKRITTSGWPRTLALAACGWGCQADTGASDPHGDASGTGGVDLTSIDTFESDEGRFVYAVPKGVRSWFDDGDGRCSPRHAKVLR